MLREDIEDMKRNVEGIHKDVVEENTFAMHLLRELKQSAKRNFIAFIITLIALVGTNIAWIIYENSFETTVEDNIQETYFTDNSTITQHIE